VHNTYARRAAGVSGQIPGRSRKIPSKWVVATKGADGNYTETPVEITSEVSGSGGTVQIGEKSIVVTTDWLPGQPLFAAVIDGKPVTIQVDRKGVGYRLFHAGSQADVRVYTQREAELARLMPNKPPPDLSKYLLSPMPGLLVTLVVAEGQEVKAGETLAVVEAMKMENVLKAERDGTVKKIYEKAGASLAVDQMILEFG
jgi:propionyl-CoA carboxylase alpha chain